MTGTRMRTIAVLSAAALVLLGACSNDSGDTPDPAPEAEPTDAETPSEEPSDVSSPDEDTDDEENDEETNTVSFQVWFANGKRLAPAIATVDRTPPVGAAALEALLGGPAGAGGLTSAVPPGTALHSLEIEDGTATVDLSSEFASGKGIPSMGMRLGQLTFTLTQFPSVKRVVLELDGERVERFSQEGLVIEKPLTRADFEDISPAIIVNRPLGGSEVAGSVRVSGTANVFEANVSIRVLTAGGNAVARTFTTATCGSGCRGTFAKRVEFDVDEPTEATLQVYEESAETGKPINMIEVPLTLLP